MGYSDNKSLITLATAFVLAICVAQVSCGMDFSIKLERVRRAVTSGSSNGQEDVTALNLAEETDEEYPVIFNILLWLGVSWFIATLAICVFIAIMDPGRDSLIYRVTSAQRFKKDN